MPLKAVDENNDLLDEMYVWISSPNISITTEEEAPAYDPDYPEGVLPAGWQYGLDDEICSIDTNLFDGNVLDALWSCRRLEVGVEDIVSARNGARTQERGSL